MNKVIIFVLSMNLQLPEEAFCALSRYEYAPTRIGDSFVPDTMQIGMKFRGILKKPKLISRNSKGAEVNTSDYQKLAIKRDKDRRPESKAKMTRNKTEIWQVIGRKKLKVSFKPFRNSVRFLYNKEKKIRSKRKRKNTKMSKLVGRNSETTFIGRRSIADVTRARVVRTTVKKKIPKHQDQYSFFTDTVPDWFTMPPEFTLPDRMSPAFLQHCNITRDHCMRGYQTGILCARTPHYYYHTFDSMCFVNYVNCLENSDLWQFIYPGPCIVIEPYSEYMHYPYQDDYFIDRDFVIEDIF